MVKLRQKYINFLAIIKPNKGLCYLMKKNGYKFSCITYSTYSTINAIKESNPDEIRATRSTSIGCPTYKLKNPIKKAEKGKVYLE